MRALAQGVGSCRPLLLCLARVLAVLVAPPDLRPPRGLPAREPSALRASLGTSSPSPARPRRPRGGLQSGEACSCECPLALPPPTGTAARPFGPSGALHTGGAALLMCGWVRRLEALPGPAAARGRRSQALRSLRYPPRRRCLGILLGNFACNSRTPVVYGSIESLEFQRLHADA